MTNVPSQQSRRRGLIGLLLVGVSFGGAYGVRAVFPSVAALNLGLAFSAILVAHAIFFSVLADSLRATTSRAKLWRNLVWYFVFVAFLIAIYAGLYADTGLKDTVATSQMSSADPWLCLYFSVVTWTTVGFGDVVPAQPLARAFAAAEAFNGAIVMAILISVLVSSFQKLLASPR